MAHGFSPRLLLALVPAGAALMGVSWSAGCAKSAEDCAALGLPEPCSGTNTASATGGAGGGGGTTTTSTSSTSVSTSSTETGSGAADGGTDGGDAGSPAVCRQKRWGDAADQQVTALVASGADTLIAGSYHGQIDVGMGPVTAGVAGSSFLAALDLNLNAKWAHSYDAAIQAMAVDGAGDIYLAGSFSSVVDIGCGALDPTKNDFFLAKLDANGVCLWSAGFKAAVTGASLAIDATGNAVLAGGITGGGDFGQTPANHGRDIVLARFNSAGGLAAVPRISGDVGDDHATGLAVDKGGNLVISGVFTGTLDFGTGGSPLSSGGHVGVFVAGFSSTGSAAWQRVLASDHDTASTGVVALPGGGVAVGGHFQGNVDVGAGALLNSPSGGFFLARFAADLGASLGAPAYIDGLAPGGVGAMAAGPSDVVALAGSVASGVYVARIDAKNGVAPLSIVGSGAQHRGAGASFGTGGRLRVGGVFDGTLTAGGPIDSAGGEDAFLLELCP